MSDPPRITFDAEGHRYTLDGKPVPSVTEILDPCYDFRFVKSEALERARDSGTKVHKCIELYEAGTLDQAALHPFLARHLKHYLAFKRDFNYVCAATEVLVASRKYQYCGQLDNHGFLLPTLPQDAELQLLLDVKTGDAYDAHELQTMGYKLAAVEMGVLTKATQRASLILSEDDYQLKWHRNSFDEAAFVSLRTFHHWRTHHPK